MRMFKLSHAGEVVAEVAMWADKSVTLHYAPGQEIVARSLATLLAMRVRTREDVLVEVDSQGQEGQRWEGQED